MEQSSFSIDYKLTEESILTHQLYLASNSERIKKKRRRDKIILVTAYIALTIYFLVNKNIAVAISAAVIGLVVISLTILWERRRYYTHYSAYARESFNNMKDSSVSLTIANDYLLVKDHATEAKINTAEIKEIAEIPGLILISFSSNTSLPIPLKEIDNIDKLRTCLQELGHNLNISYNSELSWKWK